MRWKAYFFVKRNKTYDQNKPFQTSFQQNTSHHFNLLKMTLYIFVFTDKTRNTYETSLDTYNKLMHDNITKTYKHRSGGTISHIDNEVKHISNNLGIGDQIEQMKKRECIYFAERP